MCTERWIPLVAFVRKAVEWVYFHRRSPAAPSEAVRRLGMMKLPVSDWRQMEIESITEERIGGDRE